MLGVVPLCFLVALINSKTRSGERVTRLISYSPTSKEAKAGASRQPLKQRAQRKMFPSSSVVCVQLTKPPCMAISRDSAFMFTEAGLSHTAACLLLLLALCPCFLGATGTTGTYHTCPAFLCPLGILTLSPCFSDKCLPLSHLLLQCAAFKISHMHTILEGWIQPHGSSFV